MGAHARSKRTSSPRPLLDSDVQRMHFNLSDEQLMLRDGAERYLLENYQFERRRAVLQTFAACDEAIWREFADLGWLGLTIPEAAGGLGAGLLEASLLSEALG